MDSCLRTKRKQYRTKTSRPTASFDRQWRHVNSKDTQAFGKVTFYKLITNCNHFSRPQDFLLQVSGRFVWYCLFVCNILILNSQY